MNHRNSRKVEEYQLRALIQSSYRYSQVYEKTK